MTESDFLKSGVVEIKYIDVKVKDFDDFNIELLKLLDRYHINALISCRNEGFYRRKYGDIK